MAEELELDEASWEEIKVTSFFTAATAAAFLAVYEYARRTPSVAPVFDRRRATRPSRTPPPLMRHRLFEWLFVSTDPAYLEYSGMVHRRDVIKERRRQQAAAAAAASMWEDGGGGGGGIGVGRFRLPYNIVGAVRGGWGHATGDFGLGRGARGIGGGPLSPGGVEEIVEEDEPRRKKKKKDHASSSSLSTSASHYHPNGAAVGGVTSTASFGLEKSASTDNLSTSSGRHLKGGMYNDSSLGSGLGRSFSSSSAAAAATTTTTGSGYVSGSGGRTALAVAIDPSEQGGRSLEQQQQQQPGGTSSRRGGGGGSGGGNGGEKKTRFHPDVLRKEASRGHGGLVDLDIEAGLGDSSDDDDDDDDDDDTSSTSSDGAAHLDSPASVQSDDDGAAEVTPNVRSFFGDGKKKSKGGKRRDAKARGGGGGRRFRGGSVPRHTNRLLTPDVVEVNGRRLPASVAEYAIAGDLSDEQLDLYEQRLIDMEREEERQFLERQRELGMRSGGGGGGGGHRSAGSDDGVDGDHFDLDPDLNRLGIKAPSRLSGLGLQNGSSRQKLLGPIGGALGRFFGGGRPSLHGTGLDCSVRDAARNGSARSMSSSSQVDAAGKSQSGKKAPVRHTSSSSSSAFGGTGSGSGRSVSGSTKTISTKYVNRHLKSASVTDKRPLSITDQELLRCVGLDTFVMIRFLRFGFDVTFYPFLFACLTLVPLYMTSPYEGSEEEGITTAGYFKFTMNSIEAGDNKLWVCWAFSVAYFSYVLWRQWIEWETFIALRFDFLANGDVEVDESDDGVGGVPGKKKRGRGGGGGSGSGGGSHHREELVAVKDDIQLHLEQYRNSCLVEYIPESHRRDKELFDFFNAVFPGQVKRAEVLLNATTLTRLIAERQNYILLYEDLYAKHFHANQYYRRRMENLTQEDAGLCAYIFCRCKGRAPKKPQDPKVRVGGYRFICCCGKRMVKALPFYLSEIKRLNREVEKEHRRILEERQKVEVDTVSQNFFASNIAQGLKFVTGQANDLTTNTGFVEFKSLTAKQSALQCNIVGTTDYMLVRSAPDPRDIVWENATVERSTIRVKQTQCEALLFTGTLFWSVVVTAITSISNLDKLGTFLPRWLIPNEVTFWYGLIQGYLPVVFLELLMLLVPIFLRLVGKLYIRFKTQSEIDKFTFKWHFAYRIANLVIIILKNQIYETINSLANSPSEALGSIASGISVSSQFFLNNMIVSAGTELTSELAQMPQMIKHFLMHKYITVEAKSRRALEKLEEPDKFEWGEDTPNIIFGLLVACVYSTIVPLVMGVCALYFYLATKIYTHQVLFVYSQPYESGGKLMYNLNRTVFVICYISISIFGILLSLKQAPVMAPSFFFGMLGVTVLVDKKIQQKFVEPSTTLALTNARIIDEENKRKEERKRRYEEYKAKKLAKRRQVLEDTKNAGKDRKSGEGGKGTFTRDIDKGRSSPDNGKASMLPSAGSSEDGENDDGTPKSIQIQVFREESEEQLRQRRAARLAAARGNKITNSEEGEGEESVADFFLYRQPQLNKFLWETKPRPYR